MIFLRNSALAFIILACVLSISAISVVPSSAFAANKTELRLYKINKFGQGQRVRFTGKKSKLEGCQNLKPIRSRVHRAVHYGFQSCTLYAKKDCAEGSEVTAKVGNDDPEQTVLTEGQSWFLGHEEKDEKYAKYSKEERGKKVRSWSCIAK